MQIITRPRALSFLVALALLAACGEGGGAEPAAAPPTPSEQTSEDIDMGLQAKRVAPPEVPPLEIAGLRIEALHWGRSRGLGQNGGYIVAYDGKSGKELWTLEVYHIDYDPELESDVQDVFIESMSKAGSDAVAITDERGRKYVVDLKSRSVRAK